MHCGVRTLKNCRTFWETCTTLTSSGRLQPESKRSRTPRHTQSGGHVFSRKNSIASTLTAEKCWVVIPCGRCGEQNYLAQMNFVRLAWIDSKSGLRSLTPTL